MHDEPLRRQRAGDSIEIGGIGQKYRVAVIPGLEIAGTGFNGRRLGIRTRLLRRRFDHAEIVEVPRHRTFGAELSLAEQHAYVRRRTVGIVR